MVISHGILHFLTVPLVEPDNREFSFLVLMALVVVAILWRAGLAASWNLVRNVFQRPILRLLGAVLCYVLMCVWLLSIPGWWQWSNLKSTLIWAGSFALVAVFNYEKVELGRSYFRSTLIESIGITALLSFLSSTYVFGLFAELAIAFALAALVALNVLTGRDERLKGVQTVAAALLATLSLFMLGNSVYHIVTEFDQFATSHTAREFILPVMLTLMFMPFLYGMYVYATYDEVFSSLEYLIKDASLRSCARRKLTAKFRFDTAGMKKWRRHVSIIEPKSELEIEESIAQVKRIRKREKSPYRVSPAIGWLPNHATGFLSSVGLATNEYHQGHSEWWASSTHLEVTEEAFPNNVVYYVEGDEFVVSKVKLVLHVNAPGTADVAHERFSGIVSLLVSTAIPGALWRTEEFTVRSDEAPLLLNGYEIALKRNEWPKGVKGGYDVVFTVEIANGLAPSSAPNKLGDASG